MYPSVLRSVAIGAVALAALGQTPLPDPLVRARQLYNDQKYDAAIQAAVEARKVPRLANSAAVVLGRAHLERYRQTAVPDDLVAAREALLQVSAPALSPRDRVELLIGLGESLYFDGCSEGCYSAAAEMFELALINADAVEPSARETIFEWWAGTLDRQAQFGPESDRHRLYERILERAAVEVGREETTATASYWLAAAARGTGDLERAWGAAVAGWVRAGYLGPRGTQLRNDLDSLVIRILLPERAQQHAAGDPLPALDRFQAQWDEVKRKYGGG